MKKLTMFLLAFLTSCSFAVAQVVPSDNNFVGLSSTYVPTATDWTNELTNVYTWMNTNVANTLNILTTKGDTYYFNGALTRLGVGSNGKVFTGGSLPNWATATKKDIGATTKGTLVLNDGSTALQLLPPGANGAVLQADSSHANGVFWQTGIIQQFPSGTILPWSPSKAGTSTIPSGWLLCNGTSNTPNLIGMFVIGTTPNGSSSSAATGGFGKEGIDALGTGAVTGTHNCAFSGASGQTGSLVSGTVVPAPAASPATAVFIGTTHSISFGNPNTAATSREVADWSLVYICKQ